MFTDNPTHSLLKTILARLHDMITLIITLSYIPIIITSMYILLYILENHQPPTPTQILDAWFFLIYD